MIEGTKPKRKGQNEEIHCCYRGSDHLNLRFRDLVEQKMQCCLAMQDMEMEAWKAGLAESLAYCQQATVPPECAMRLIKLSASLRELDADWVPLFLPPYLQVVERYEAKLKSKAGTLYPIDRRLTDELKVTASLTDQGVLTQDQMKRLVVSALQNLRDNLMREYQGLEYEYRVALASDAQIASALAEGIAAGLVIAATAAAVAATSRAYRAPVSSQSFFVFVGGRSYTCFSTPTMLSCL